MISTEGNSISKTESQEVVGSQRGSIQPVDLTQNALFDLSTTRRYALLGIFALSTFVDVSCSSAFYVFTPPITRDLRIEFAQQSWIITSYAITFASFFMLFGRLSDLHSPKTIFCSAFAAIGIFNLCLSFLTDRYSFLILRSFTGIAAAAVVPSSYRLIPMIFPPSQRPMAFTLFMMTGSISNSLGVIIAGVFALNPLGAEMSGWRWFFRAVAMVSIIASCLALRLIPRTAKVDNEKALGWLETVKRLDIPGVICIEASIICLILGLTFGASFGWRTVAFLFPFLLGIVLFPTFFWWEHYMTQKSVQYALLPSYFWGLPNFTVLIVFSLVCLGYWAVNFLAFIEWFVDVEGEDYIVAAARILPEGISAVTVSLLCIQFPQAIARPRWPIIIAMCLCVLAYVLWSQAPSFTGKDYWRWVMPGMMIGSGGMQIVLLSTNIGIMMTAPPESSGVAGAVFSMSTQISVVIALAIQAGMFSVHPGGIANRLNIQLSFYVELGWTALWLLGFVVFHKPGRTCGTQMSRRHDAEQRSVGSSESAAVGA